MHKLSWSPDAVVYSPKQFREWTFSAGHGERCLYHIGQMSVDQQDRPALKEMGDFASVMSEIGILVPNQRRVTEGTYQYIAARTSNPSTRIPKQLGLGEVSPETYMAIRAIEEKDPRVSTSRSIYYAIGGRSSDAILILDRLIAAGFIEAGSPPLITAKGYEALR